MSDEKKFRRFYLADSNISTETGQEFRVAATYPNGIVTGKYIPVIEEAALEAAQKEIAELKGLFSVQLDMHDKLLSAEKEIETLRKVIDLQSDALEFYAADRTWSPDLFMTGSEVMRSDLSETIWSRFTPGKRARKTLEQVKTILEGEK